MSAILKRNTHKNVSETRAIEKYTTWRIKNIQFLNKIVTYSFIWKIIPKISFPTQKNNLELYFRYLLGKYSAKLLCIKGFFEHYDNI